MAATGFSAFEFSERSKDRGLNGVTGCSKDRGSLRDLFFLLHEIKERIQKELIEFGEMEGQKDCSAERCRAGCIVPYRMPLVVSISTG